MKNIINKIAVGLFTCGLVTGVTAEEYKTYQFINETGVQEISSASTDYHSDQEIVLGNDDKIEIINIAYERAKRLLFEINYGDAYLTIENNLSLGTGTGGFTGNVVPAYRIIHGPCTVTIGAQLHNTWRSKWGGDTYPGGKLICTVKVTRAKEPKGANITVLPETSSDLNLVLESSDDLVG